MVEIPLRRGALNVTEDEISIQHSMTQYAKNILNSWHGPVWAVIAVIYVIQNAVSGPNPSVNALLALGEITIFFAVFLAGIHILRFRELPLSKQHTIKAEEVTEIKPKIAMNAETWFVREMYQINFQRDGKNRNVIIMPLKGYEEKLSEIFAERGYPMEKE